MIKRFFLLFLLFASILSQKALAVSIVLDGTQTLLSGYQCQTAKYRFGTQSSYLGNNIDLILEVTAEDNEYSLGRCVSIVDNVIGFNLRDKDFSNNYSYMDVKITVVKKGTETPLNVDAITVTNFDLDNNPYYTGTDDVYYANPSKVYLSEFTNVTQSSGTFFSNYTTKLRGQSTGNCDDGATLLQKECRAGVSFNNTSSFYARVQNDNAYGTDSYKSSNYRLIQFSFELKDLTPLISEVEVPCTSINNYSTSNTSWIEGSTRNGYSDNLNISKSIKITDAQDLKITINGETEYNYDWIYIYDENNNQIYVGSGEFNNKIINLSGSTVTIKLTSDQSKTKTGVTINIEGIGCEEDEPTISIADSVEVTEGDNGDKDLIFTINLDHPAPNGGINVQIDPTNITANEGEDYTRENSSLFFVEGESQQTVIYKIHGDTKVEDNETFSVELHNPQNAILDENHKTAIATILNDDRDSDCDETAKSIDIRVSSTNDDAEESESGSMYRTSSDLELVEDGHEQTIGIRFRNLSIPQGAIITNAYLQFSVDETSDDETNLNIYGENVDNSNEFLSDSYNISHRVKTSANSSWSPREWDEKHEQGEDQRSSNLQNIVQEIVNREGWNSGNALSFIITGSGKRVAESYDGEHEEAPLLHIEYLSCDDDESNTNDASTAVCYALTDNSDKLYKVSMLPNGDPLPRPSIISISTDFNGEGSAYRASDNKFYAFKGHSDDQGPSDIYAIDVDTGATTKLKESLIDGAVDGAEFYFDPTLNKEILYIISGENSSKLYAFDPDGWIPLSGYPKSTNANLSSLAINPVSGEAYAIDDYNYDGKRPNVYKLDLKTAVTTQITTLQNLADAEGLAFASDGNLYIEDEGRDDLEGKRLYKVNLETGELTPSAITDASGDIEGLSCNGTQMAMEYPTIKIDSNSSVLEGNSSSTDLNFIVTLSKPALEATSLSYSITDVSTVAGVDYSIESNQTIFIPKDSTSAIITIKVNGDIEVEDNETLLINLTHAENAIINNSSVQGTIINDDKAEVPELIAEYRFDECPLDLDEEIEDHTPYRHRHRVRNGFTTQGDISQINRSGAFHRDQKQYTEGEDGLDDVFGDTSHEFTITTWVYPTSLSSDKTNHSTANTIFAKASDSKNDNIEIGINSDGTVHLYLDTTVKDTFADFGVAGDISENSWHFVGVSYKDGEVTVQIDDKTYTNNTTWSGATTIDQAVGSPTTIGASLHIDNYFDGYMDEFKIFRNQLTARTMNQFRERERNRRNWDDTEREEVVCEEASPIGCLQTAWMFQNQPTDINALNLVNGQMAPIKEDITTDNINAVGFNKIDGFFWGYNHTKQNGTVTRIGMNSQGQWVAENFLVDELAGFDSYVGDIDGRGQLYLKESGSSTRVVVIDLDPNSSTYLKKTRDFNLDFSLNVADWGFNSNGDNMLYAVDTQNLYKIDPSTGHKLSQQDTSLTTSRTFGASFFDANGFYYVYDNYSGDIFRIDVANASKAVLFATGGTVSLNDGAMCTDAEFKFDFGDLPENYPTNLESDGARHSLPTYGEPVIFMGSAVSSENNGKPSNDASLDSDDDGVKLNNGSLQDQTINAGATTTLTITTQGEGYLSAWIDWNSDGDFDDISEKVATNIDGTGGVITLNITAPSSAIDRVTYARFRYSSQEDLNPTGSAINGEVEDYRINIQGNLEAFSCNETFYFSNRSENETESEDSGATWLHSFYALTPAYTTIGNGFASDNGGYNAIGYNVQDNFIYALYGNQLLKIDKNANVKNLGIIDGLPDTQLYAGEFDRDGFYYVSGNGNADDKMYKIDIAQQKVIATITLSSSVRFWDMAVDTTGSYFYTMLIKDGDSDSDYNNAEFAKIDINSGDITTIGESHENEASYISLIFSDGNGKVIAVANENGMYEIDAQTGAMYRVNSTSSLNYYNDGTSCPDANFTLPPHLPRLSIGDVTKAEGDNGETLFEFKVSIDADLPMIPMGMPTMFLYKVLDGDNNDITMNALESDNDFQESHGMAINIDVFSNSRSYTITVPVYGDTKVEKDEEFYVEIYFPDFFPSNFVLMGKDRGVGTILNDDMRFKVVRTNGDNDEDSLYTQISGRDFDYSVLSEGDINIDSMTLKIDLIDNNSSSNYLLSTAYKYINNKNRIDIVDSSDLALLRATKDARFKISFLKDENGTIVHGDYANEHEYSEIENRVGYTQVTRESSDHFAIRPAGYKVEIQDVDDGHEVVYYRDSSYSKDDSLNLVADYDYILNTKAIAYDENHSIAIGYTNDANATLKFDDKQSCNDTNNSQISGYLFSNGLSTDTLTHENTGKYLISIIDDSWSNIDKESEDCIEGSSIISENGNEKSGCNISTTSMDDYQEIQVRFNPYRFDMSDTRLSNVNGSTKEYLYMSNLHLSREMAVELNSTIIARGAKGNELSNFTNSCIDSSTKVSLNLDFSFVTDLGQFDISNYTSPQSVSGTPLDPQQIIEFNQESNNSVAIMNPVIGNIENNFLDENNGSMKISILYNMDKLFRDPTNPIEVNFISLDLNTSNVDGKIEGEDETPVGKGNIDQNKTFYFARVASYVEEYPSTDKKSINTPLFVEIFCKKQDSNESWCEDTMKLGTIGEVIGGKTIRGWYLAKNHDSSTEGNVSRLVVLPPNDEMISVSPATDIPPFINGEIKEIDTRYLPESDITTSIRAEIAIDTDVWLRFNRNAVIGMPLGTSSYFINIKAISSTTGAGTTGNLIEAVQKTEHNGKISW